MTVGKGRKEGRQPSRGWDKQLPRRQTGFYRVQAVWGVPVVVVVVVVVVV